jgi:hypothetical protein
MKKMYEINLYLQQQAEMVNKYNGWYQNQVLTDFFQHIILQFTFTKIIRLMG